MLPEPALPEYRTHFPAADSFTGPAYHLKDPESVLLPPPCTSSVALTGVSLPTFAPDLMVTTQFCDVLLFHSWYVVPPENELDRWTEKPPPQTWAAVYGFFTGAAVVLVGFGSGGLVVFVGVGLGAWVVLVGVGVAVGVGLAVGRAVFVTVAVGLACLVGVFLTGLLVGVAGGLAVFVTVGLPVGTATELVGSGAGVGTVVSTGTLAVPVGPSVGSTIGPTSSSPWPGVVAQGAVTSPWGCVGTVVTAFGTASADDSPVAVPPPVAAIGANVTLPEYWLAPHNPRPAMSTTAVTPATSPMGNGFCCRPSSCRGALGGVHPLAGSGRPGPGGGPQV
ncbi:hypothetical protein AB0J43_52995 [Nonomuraea fuscirosea]